MLASVGVAVMVALAPVTVSLHARQAPAAPPYAMQCEPFPNQRIIMASLTKDYLPLFQNWFKRAKKLLKKEDALVLISEDAGAATWLLENRASLGDFVAIVDPAGQLWRDGEAPLALWKPADRPIGGTYGDSGFGAMMSRRPEQILTFLHRNCSVLFTDVDLVWLKDPFEAIEEAGSHDLYIIDDDIQNGYAKGYNRWKFCGCFMYLHPAPGVIELVQDWADRTGVEDRNQPSFNAALQHDYEGAHTVNWTVLGFKKFPPACQLQRFPDAMACHANFRKGVAEKEEFLKEQGLWR